MSPRRTLQSGYSLMSRGEPKIWLTGGMLVICLAMIVSLLSLIVINGLSTFWPGPVHWLVLSNDELDVGEPQRQEIRPATSQAATSAPTSDASKPENSAKQGQAKASQPSYFYRTANFDITNRHYRWFPPEELVADGIIVPDWALVIERLSWGRMYALPSRLALPLHPEQHAESSKLLATLADSQALLSELSSDLQALATTEPTVPLEAITTAVQQQINSVRSGALRALVAQAQTGAQTNNAESASSAAVEVQIQADESGPWRPAVSPSTDSMVAARQVIDRPQPILDRLQTILSELTASRHKIDHLMHQISMLDGRLSEARIAVRQAELDTGRVVLDKLDSVVPLVDGLINYDRTLARIQSTIESADQLFSDKALAQQLRDLLTRYKEQTLLPLGEAFKSELQFWQDQFANDPPAIQRATADFAQAWRKVAESKSPLETQMRVLEAQGAGYELIVMVPTDAVQIEVAAADSAALLDSQWTDGLKTQLQSQSVEPSSASPRVTRLTSQVTMVEFDTVSQGSVALWCIQRLSNQPVWLMPQQRTVNCAEIVRLFPANRLSVAGKFEVYFQRWREFLLENPREGNTEGGVFPAIWGTVVMTLIMTLAVVPFGVIAALYLREYTRSGPIVSLVRISINNLAGVPSIVYGVFGLAFFCYSMGAFIDGGARNAQFGMLPTSTWYGVLAGTVLVGVVAFLFSIMSGGRDRSTSVWKRRLAALAPLAWLLSLIGIGVLVFKSPFFDGLYEARLPSPTFGKEGLLWASLTLALLTLPVVIVATEEALSAVPNSLREGSLACGASKWQTIYRIVLPHARPGILTGAILAMARGVGEVAPLMLVGALPVAPDLPLDSEFPYFHGSRSFMHLGYQIYWLGFQSQNSEASKPLVFTCTLLLILIVISLNLSAILLRARLRKRFQGNQF